MILSYHSYIFCQDALRQQKILDNLDKPEGGFDGLMQVAVCESVRRSRGVFGAQSYIYDAGFFQKQFMATRVRLRKEDAHMRAEIKPNWTDFISFNIRQTCLLFAQI